MEADQHADQYAIHLLLGEGGQANVYLGSKDLEVYALKIYHAGASKEEAYRVEADFLRNLSFPNIINMVTHRPSVRFKLDGHPEERRPMLVLEFAEGGELFEYISKTGRFAPEVCRTYFKQLISVVRYLNSIDITHRDLKPENILFDKDYTLRVSDFGLSRDTLGPNRDYRLRSRVGTEGYKPVEMMQGNYTGLQADLFAAGVILFIMYNGTPPFLSTAAEDNIYRLIKTQNFNRFWALHEARKPAGFFPVEFKRLINSILSADVERRPTLEALANDDWVIGDEMMQNQLIEYMSAKAQRLAERDPVKAEIAAIRRRLYERKLQEDRDRNCEEGGNRFMDITSDPSLLEEGDRFLQTYKKYEIILEDLPQFTLKKAVYVKQNPAYVVAWVETFLAESLKQKEVFMSDFVSEIVPKEYTLEYNPEKHLLKAKLQFEIIGEEEEQTELILTGQLHRSNAGLTGIEWCHTEGNAFWLNAIELHLNDYLRQLA